MVRCNVILVTSAILLLFFQVATAQLLTLKSCNTADGSQGSCVYYQQCDLMNGLFQDGLFGIGKMFNSVCSVGIFSFMVCCPDQRNTYANNQSTGRRLKREKSAVEKLPRPPQCGVSKAPHNRVVGGTPAASGAWPWIANLGAIYGSEPEDRNFICSASLISSKYLITAAHCMDKDFDYYVRLGDKNIDKSDHGADPVEIPVKKYIVHPKYDDDTKENDIAILKLKSPVKFTALIQPICLPIDDEMKNRDLVGTYPFIAGWGRTAYEGEDSDVLRETQVPVVTTEKCKKSYENKTVVIDGRTLCAGYATGGKDACKGDSGGPLMFPHKMTYYLIGVVSNGVKCGSPEFPGVYTRVSKFIDFIESHMK